MIPQVHNIRIYLGQSPSRHRPFFYMCPTLGIFMAAEIAHFSWIVGSTLSVETLPWHSSINHPDGFKTLKNMATSSQKGLSTRQKTHQPNIVPTFSQHFPNIIIIIIIIIIITITITILLIPILILILILISIIIIIITIIIIIIILILILILTFLLLLIIINIVLLDKFLVLPVKSGSKPHFLRWFSDFPTLNLHGYFRGFPACHVWWHRRVYLNQLIPISIPKSFH